jgi:methyltransferase FkbM-like protein
MKSLIKSILFGKTPSVREIRYGLLRGLRFHINPNHKSQRLMGLDEREVVSITRRLADRVKSAVDIGANDGWYSLFFATRPSMETVFACEPAAESIHQFQVNLAANADRIRAKVSIISRFLGTNDGQLAVDAMLENVPGPHLLKIDVDGGELEVLRSAEKTLATRGVCLIVETHSVKLERDCIQFLEDRGFQCTIIPNGWYRCIVPEQRPIPHNRWFSAEKS